MSRPIGKRQKIKIKFDFSELEAQDPTTIVTSYEQLKALPPASTYSLTFVSEVIPRDCLLEAFRVLKGSPRSEICFQPEEKPKKKKKESKVIIAKR